MNLFAWSGLILGATIFPLGIFVFWQKKDSWVNRMLALFCFAGSFWGFGALRIATLDQDQSDLAMFWWKLTHIGVIFMPIFLVHFIFEFLELKRRKTIIFLYASGILFLVFNFFTDLFIVKMRWAFDSFYWDSPPGPLYYPFALFFFTLIVYGHYELFLALKKTSGQKNAQIKYIFMAALFGFTGGGTSFLPVFGIDLYPFLNFATPLYPIIISYAIIKHHLMDIKVIATEIFAVLLSLVLLINAFLSNKSTNVAILDLSIFAFVSFLSILLVKGTIKEVKAKERLEDLAEKLERANEDLKKLDKAKSEFISIASHQLRTPLSIIKGYASMLLEGSYGMLPEKAKDIISKVSQSNERLISLINDLLDISRMEGGRMKFEWNFIILSDLVKSVAEELKPQADKKGLALNLQTLGEKTYVRADEEKLRQVVMNLIDNAIKYTPKGKVDISVQKAEENKIRLTIKDTGIGMRKEEMDVLFGKFVRGREVPKVWTEGVGLGLYVAKMIMEEHRGKVWAESEGENKGSTFIVELPVY